VKEGTAQRREGVLRELGDVGDVLALFGKWDETLAPGSCMTKAGTLLCLRPDLKCRVLKEIMDGWEIERAVRGQRHAVAPEPRRMASLVPQLPILVRTTVLLLWVSVSRYGDLATLRMEKVADRVAKLSWTVQKSDRKGRRRLVKFVYWPGRIPHTWARYREVYEAVKRKDPELTVHSFRRGAATALANLGYAMEDIQLLTQHTPTEDARLAVRRYVDPSHTQPESVKQIGMSKDLWNCLASCGRTQN
jgi:integrase